MSFKKIENKYLKTLLNNFDIAAQTYGWEIDQGSEISAKKALDEYLLAEDQLIKYLNRQSRELQRLKKIVKPLKKDVYIEGGSKSCGKAHSSKEAIDLAYNRYPEDIKKEIPKSKLAVIEFENSYTIM